MVKYENPKTSGIDSGVKKWTKGVPIILIDKDGGMITTDHWVYVNNNDELVYNKKKNLWTQGSEFYDIGKSHIKEVYVVSNETIEVKTTSELFNSIREKFQKVIKEKGLSDSDVQKMLDMPEEDD
jgi:hypothetical protein